MGKLMADPEFVGKLLSSMPKTISDVISNGGLLRIHGINEVHILLFNMQFMHFSFLYSCFL